MSRNTSDYRRILRSSNYTQTSPPESLLKKPKKRLGVIEESPSLSEFDPMEGFLSPGVKELQALAKRVEDEFGTSCSKTSIAATGVRPVPLFRRGNKYEEYSQRRNERLKRKKWETNEMKDGNNHDPTITDSGGKRKVVKRTENLRRSVPANFSLRSKENSNSKYLVVNSTKERSAIDGSKKREGAPQMGRRTRVF